ncbi:hypothetical protein [Streptomyces californicus]|uniref:hypothetical protein n=1 Tax=Streptomyces californicus TaxID=67351 RepID=UPI0037AC1F59
MWLRTPENLDRLAAITRAADASRRNCEDKKLSAAPDAPAADLRHREEAPVGRSSGRMGIGCRR